VTDILKEGDTVKVKVLEISRDGKIRLSRKALLNESSKPSGKK
jgi:polyribonucleotide nucleotidyltransferase